VKLDVTILRVHTQHLAPNVPSAHKTPAKNAMPRYPRAASQTDSPSALRVRGPSRLRFFLACLIVGSFALGSPQSRCPSQLLMHNNNGSGLAEESNKESRNVEGNREHCNMGPPFPISPKMTRRTSLPHAPCCGWSYGRSSPFPHLTLSERACHFKRCIAVATNYLANAIWLHKR
jgi:hypothetical protein